MNETPNYVMHLNEVGFPGESKITLQRVLRYVVGGVLLLLLMASFVFEENLFGDLSWFARITLIGLAIYVFTGFRIKKEPSPLELWFYQDRLLIYRPRFPCSKRIIQREYYQMYYSQITEIEIGTVTDVVRIFGACVSTVYVYNRDGTLPLQPKVHKFVQKGMVQFFYDFEKTHDFVCDFKRDVELHSPLRIIITNT